MQYWSSRDGDSILDRQHIIDGGAGGNGGFWAESNIPGSSNLVIGDEE